MKKRIIVVLGMHRSGTSAITRSLQVLGVELGNDLMPAIKGNNEKGFFEDNSINALNVELLKALNSDWHYLEKITHNDVDFFKENGYFDKALNLLKNKIDSCCLFGFKDPRTSKLLLFWQEVFKELSVDVDYVLIVRNPLCVAKSLLSRDGLDTEKGYLLWLAHMMPSLINTTQEQRVTVEYNRLLESPEYEITRVAKKLKLKVNNEELDLYLKSFLDKKLRNENYTDTDLLNDQSCPALVKEIYVQIIKEVKSADTDDFNLLTCKVSQWVSEYEHLTTSIIYIDKLYFKLSIEQQRVNHLNEALLNKDVSINEINETLVSKEANINELNEMLVSKEANINELNEMLVSKEANINELSETLVNKEVKINKLKDELVTKDFDIEKSIRLLNQKDSELEIIEQSLRSKGEILIEQQQREVVLENTLKEISDEIQLMSLKEANEIKNRKALEQSIQDLKNSWSWRCTAPLRSLGSIIKFTYNRIQNKACIFKGFVPTNCELYDGRYISSSNDPYLVLESEIEPDVYELKGWISFEFKAKFNTDKVTPSLYIDFGEGFSEIHRYPLCYNKGTIFGCYFFEKNIKNIRLDPDESQIDFHFSGLEVKQVDRLAVLSCKTRELKSIKKSEGQGSFDIQISSFKSFLNGARKQLFKQLVEIEASPELQLEIRQKWLVENKNNGMSKKLVRLNSNSNASIGFDNESNKYLLCRNPSSYTYIPKRKPSDFEKTIIAMDHKPFLSILVPIYNTPLDLLEKMLSSVESQWYENYELILADDCSPNEDVREALSQITNESVNVVWLEQNKGIAGASNVALDAAKGDFIVLLDHDDELTADCLYELALCINRDDSDFIYSDEDKLSEEGAYVEPHFKPGWSPDTMMSTMYTCHVCCIRTSLIRSIGGFRSEYDGCQDWDLILRVTEKTDKISHIPKVLYHWRIIPQSIASSLSAKSYAIEASKNVRLDAMKRRGYNGVMEEIKQVPGYFRVRYELVNSPLISIIIPTRDNAKVLKACIDSIYALSSYKNIEVIILDNGSVNERTLSYLEEVSNEGQAKVIRHDHPFNYSELNNIGAREASGELLLFLNDDTEVITPDWLERLGGYAQLKHSGAIGAKLLYPDSTSIQHGGILNLQAGPGHAFLQDDGDAPGYYMRSLLEYNWFAVTGACLMVDAKKFEVVGGFDEDFPIAYNDVELCMRLLDAGYYNTVCQAARLTHHESISRGHDDVNPEKMLRLEQERKRMYYKHPDFFQNDPFYNVNLHPNGIKFEMCP
ncbi:MULTISPECIES: glycosyltransferase [unclassified Pseudoalteromonas]|uniref:glycosyltransferase n=1 Tax=unclassified Pseudoalteromonas TaxID=194690 RepID=UPI0006947E8D|nr:MULTISPECIES: glycosyltransferase [unclassified Pseudoalteromonas]